MEGMKPSISILAAVGVATLATTACAAVSPAHDKALMFCVELNDADRTRVVAEFAGGITRLELVTPEFLWPAPGQPETRRFPAGVSDVSPNLAGIAGLALATTFDHRGMLRIVDFASLTPDALPMAGLRGSLVLHDDWLNRRAPASLYYTASDQTLSITPLMCTRQGAMPEQPRTQ